MGLLQRDWLTGRENILVRLYRIRLLPALLICLPFWFVLSWYGIFAYTNHVSYNKGYGFDQPLTLEIFHLRLHDLVGRDWRRLTIPDLQAESSLPTLAIYMPDDEMAKLDQEGPPEEGKGKYSDGWLKKGKKTVKARFRYRGKEHWNWNYAQKSWKVRVEDDLVLGQQTFSFVNPVSPAPFLEEYILTVAEARHLLTPEYFPIRLVLNNAFMGIYYWMGQPDEFMLRRAPRMPGSLYSGNGADVDKKRGVSSLWFDPKAWKKPASRAKALEEDDTELALLLAMVSEPDQLKFEAFAREHIDLERFATMDALDVVFGGNQHDYDQDHKLYFDPYRWRFEPVAWDFRGFEHRPAVNRAENPLQLRLKEIPGYLTMRNRIVLELIDGECSPARVASWTRGPFAARTAEFSTDPYWDAYGLLPEISKYWRQMIRPMTEARLVKSAESRLGIYQTRVDFLRSELTKVDVSVTVEEKTGQMIFIDVGGWSGVRVEKILTKNSGDCKGVGRVIADRDGNGMATPGERDWAWSGSELGLGLDLEPGVVLVARDVVSTARGKVRLVPEARRYGLLFDMGPSCRVESAQIWLRPLAGGDPVVVTSGQSVVGPGAGVERGCTSGGELFEPGRRSIHPWCRSEAVLSEQVWGPGTVDLPSSIRLGPEVTVRVLPGTTLRLGPGVSLILHGQLFAVGSADAPIRIQRLDSEREWGALTLQGPGTAGSRIGNVLIHGGSMGRGDLSDQPGMINIHDTSDIEVVDSKVTGSQGTASGKAIYVDSEEDDEGGAAGADMIHVAYVGGLRVTNCTLERAGSDALDLEFSSGVISSTRILGTGDECLDLMGSEVTVVDSVFGACGGNGVSAGEETTVDLTGVGVAGAVTGVLAKNHSKVRTDRVVIYGCGRAFRLEKHVDRYAGLSRIRSERTWLVLNGEDYSGPDKRWKWESGGNELDADAVSALAGLWPSTTDPDEAVAILIGWSEGQQ